MVEINFKFFFGTLYMPKFTFLRLRASKEALLNFKFLVVTLILSRSS